MSEKLSGKSLQERQNVLVNFRLTDLLFSINFSRHVKPPLGIRVVPVYLVSLHSLGLFPENSCISRFAPKQSAKFILPVIKVTGYLCWEGM